MVFLSWTDAICFFKSLFLDNLWSQTSHLNGLFHSWTVAICQFSSHTFDKICSHKIHIWTAHFLYGPMQHNDLHNLYQRSVVTYLTFEWLISIMNSWNMPYWFLVNILIKSILSHKLYIQIACFLHNISGVVSRSVVVPDSIEAS